MNHASKGDSAPIIVPDPTSDWRDIWQFALTYDAYERHGDFQTAAMIGNDAQRDWHENGELPDDLAVARAALFFEQRRWRHFGVDPSHDDADYIRALLGRIGELSGGAVSGPPDHLP